MKLYINAFRTTLSTNHGPYGVTATFDRGLNVIRAENTSGKSALINGMLYALGLEILVGKRGIEATKPVLRSEGDYEGIPFNVIESFVEIEIINQANKVITARRYIAGGKDNRLIEVVHGAVITGVLGKKYSTDSYFVGLEGSAQRERGFHHFLANFLDFNLPFVKRFQGNDVPLYVECIAPLMFIEQIRGWSGFQATLPQSYGIRNVAKVAVEYLLRLDVIENDKKRVQISEEASMIREGWVLTRGQMNQLASRLGGRLLNVSTAPVTSITDEPWIAIFQDNENAIDLDAFLVAKREQFLNISDDKKITSPECSELESKLEVEENRLLAAQAGLLQVRSDIRYEEVELNKLGERLEFVKNDIQRNKDILRLRNLGGEAGLSILKDICPTCNQAIQDSLIPTENVIMGVEENIKFLNTEAEAVSLLISSGKERLDRLQSEKDFRSQQLSNIRMTIRDLRSDLLGNKNLSIAVIREQIHLQEEVARLEDIRNEFEELVERLGVIAEQWQNNRVKHSELPKDYFSREDKNKLADLSELFSKNVREFGYRSTGMTQLKISPDNYRPVLDEFEVAFAASASDNIRMIWAYTLALLQVSLDHNGNHWGVLLFDEPEQQKMKEASSDAFYKAIARMQKPDFQAIIATSAPIDVTDKRLSALPHNLLEYGERVIRPIK